MSNVHFRVLWRNQERRISLLRLKVKIIPQLEISLVLLVLAFTAASLLPIVLKWPLYPQSLLQILIPSNTSLVHPLMITLLMSIPIHEEIHLDEGQRSHFSSSRRRQSIFRRLPFQGLCKSTCLPTFIC